MQMRMLIFRVAVLTLAYLLAASITVVGTTLAFQPRNIHPDYWHLNAYDLAGQMICLVIYSLAVLIQVYRYNKKRHSDASGADA